MKQTFDLGKKIEKFVGKELQKQDNAVFVKAFEQLFPRQKFDGKKLKTVHIDNTVEFWYDGTLMFERTGTKDLIFSYKSPIFNNKTNGKYN